MRYQKLFLAGTLLAGLCFGPLRAAEPPAEDVEDFKVAPEALDKQLIEQLHKSEREAQDASFKLAQRGKRVIGLLAEIVQKDKSKQASYYAALSLAHIQNPAAAAALLPVLKNTESERGILLVAIEATGADGTRGAFAELSRLAHSHPDGDVQLAAFKSLSLMIESYASMEPAMIEFLGDSRDQFREIAVKTCYQAASRKVFFRHAEPKLLELAEHDSSSAIQSNAMSALARMGSKQAVAVFVRLMLDPKTPSSVSKQALNNFTSLTGVPLRDLAAVPGWWEKYGEKEYAHAAPLIPPGTPILLPTDGPGPQPLANGPGPAPQPVATAPNALNAQSNPPPHTPDAAPTPVAVPDKNPPPSPTGAPATKGPALRKQLDDDDGPTPYHGVPMGH